MSRTRASARSQPVTSHPDSHPHSTHETRPIHLPRSPHVAGSVGPFGRSRQRQGAGRRSVADADDELPLRDARSSDRSQHCRGPCGLTPGRWPLRIGAMTRQRDMEVSAEVASAFPILREALRHVGHRQTRNRGTIGGSLVISIPPPSCRPCAVALDGRAARRRAPAARVTVAIDGFRRRLHDARDRAGRDPDRHQLAKPGRRAMATRSTNSRGATAISPSSASPRCSSSTRPARSHAPPLRSAGLGPIGRMRSRPRERTAGRGGRPTPLRARAAAAEPAARRRCDAIVAAAYRQHLAPC